MKKEYKVGQEVPQEHTIAWIVALLEAVKEELQIDHAKGSYFGLCVNVGVVTDIFASTYKLGPRQTEVIYRNIKKLLKRHGKVSHPNKAYWWGDPSSRTYPLRLKALNRTIERVKGMDIDPDGPKT